MNKLTFSLTLALALCLAGQNAFANEKSSNKSGDTSSTDKTFVNKAAGGSLAEVELGRIAAEKGQSQQVKDFGNQMVKDHSKANDELKTAASGAGLSVPDKADAKHQAVIDKFSKMSAGDAFDKAYAKEMVRDHEEDIAEFQKADKEVKNTELKSFIEKTVPVMKHHLEMAKEMSTGKK